MSPAPPGTQPDLRLGPAPTFTGLAALYAGLTPVASSALPVLPTRHRLGSHCESQIGWAGQPAARTNARPDSTGRDLLGCV